MSTALNFKSVKDHLKFCSTILTIATAIPAHLIFRSAEKARITMQLQSFVYDGVWFDGPYSKESVLATKNFQGLSDDIYVSTFPRSGTTWVQNILIGMLYGLDVLENNENFEMNKLTAYLEITLGEITGCDLANQMVRRPRLLKSHQPTNLAPQEIFSLKRKNVVVFRSPKDALLSFHEFYHKNTFIRDFASPTLGEFLDRSLAGQVLNGSWWLWAKPWLDFCR